MSIGCYPGGAYLIGENSVSGSFPGLIRLGYLNLKHARTNKIPKIPNRSHSMYGAARAFCIPVTGKYEANWAEAEPAEDLKTSHGHCDGLQKFNRKCQLRSENSTLVTPAKVCCELKLFPPTYLKTCLQLKIPVNRVH